MPAWLLLLCALPSADAAGKRYLIVHADDAGMSHSVNRATIEALDKGVVTSASIMVPCPWFGEFARYARENPQHDYGIHLTLNSEWDVYRWGPVAERSRVPSLIDPQGFLWDNVRQVAEQVKAEEVEIELRAQIERAQAMGVPLSHLDTHMGAMFSRPDLARLYVKLGREYDLPVLAVKPTPSNRIDVAYPELARILDPLRDAGLPILDEIHQYYEPGAHDERKRHYLQLIRQLPPGVTEIIIHCGYDDAELRAITSSHGLRDSDRRVFLDPEVKAAIEAEGIELTSWKEFRELDAARGPD